MKSEQLKINIKQTNGSEKTIKAIQVKALPGNLADLAYTVFYTQNKHESILFQLSNTEKQFQVLSLKDGLVDSVSILIGHKGKVFRQFIYGNSFLIMPFNKKGKKIEDQSSYSIN